MSDDDDKSKVDQSKTGSGTVTKIKPNQPITHDSAPEFGGSIGDGYVPTWRPTISASRPAPPPLKPGGQNPQPPKKENDGS